MMRVCRFLLGYREWMTIGRLDYGWRWDRIRLIVLTSTGITPNEFNYPPPPPSLTNSRTLYLRAVGSQSVNLLRPIVIAFSLTILVACGGGGGEGGTATVSPTTPPATTPPATTPPTGGGGGTPNPLSTKPPITHFYYDHRTKDDDGTYTSQVTHNFNENQDEMMAILKDIGEAAELEYSNPETFGSEKNGVTARSGTYEVAGTELYRQWGVWDNKDIEFGIIQHTDNEQMHYSFNDFYAYTRGAESKTRPDVEEGSRLIYRGRVITATRIANSNNLQDYGGISGLPGDLRGEYPVQSGDVVVVVRGIDSGPVIDIDFGLVVPRSKSGCGGGGCSLESGIPNFEKLFPSWKNVAINADGTFSLNKGDSLSGSGSSVRGTETTGKGSFFGGGHEEVGATFHYKAVTWPGAPYETIGSFGARITDEK